MVHLDILLDATGRVKSVQVLQAYRPELVAPAVAAVRKFRFAPAERNGQPVESHYSLALNPAQFDPELWDKVARIN